MKRPAAALALACLVSTPALADDPADALGAALADATRAYDAVSDYKATFVKRERSKEGPLGPDEEIYLKFVKPFKIYMEWQNTDKKGLQIFYQRGKNDGKLAVHQPGLFFGLAQLVFLPQDSPWVREGSASFDIEDAGIGTFLADFSEAVAEAGRRGQLVVTARPDGAFEVTFPGEKEEEPFFAKRVVVGFDPATKLPTKQELYDWGAGDPIGFYDYRNVKTNVGDLDDIEFKHRANRHLYKNYARPAEARRAPSKSNFAR